MKKLLTSIIGFTLISANCYADYTLEVNKELKYIQTDYGHKVERTGFVCDFDSFDKHFKLAKVDYSYIEEKGVKTWQTDKASDSLSVDGMRMAYVLLCENKA